MFMKGPEKHECVLDLLGPQKIMLLLMEQAFLNNFGEANDVLSNWQNQPSKKCMVFSNAELMTLPANILNVIMGVEVFH